MDTTHSNVSLTLSDHHCLNSLQFKDRQLQVKGTSSPLHLDKLVIKSLTDVECSVLIVVLIW